LLEFIYDTNNIKRINCFSASSQ